MVKVDLITGFLGAGKTTFIRRYIEYLKTENHRICIIENEFGDISVDKELLDDKKSGDCFVADLTGMCMCCVGKKAFINLLLEAAASNIDRIIVEPSGIYDVDEFFDVMSEPGVSKVCEIGCIVSVVDSGFTNNLTKEVRYLTFTQILSSGTIYISKTDIYEKHRSRLTISHIENLLQEMGAVGILGEVCDKALDELTDSDFEDIANSGYMRVVHDREVFEHSGLFTSWEQKESYKDKADIERKVRNMFEGDKSRIVYRVKGFVRTNENDYYEVNCTGEYMSILPCKRREERLVVIGQKI